MVVSIGAIASAGQGVTYYERDGYYAKDDPRHLEASAWAGKGAEGAGLRGRVEPGTFRDILEGIVPDGSGRRLGRREKDGTLSHRPGRDLTFSAPKSASLAAMLGGDAAVVAAHDAAVIRKAFERLGSNVAEVKADNIAGAVAARWLRLSAEERENTGVMAPSHELRVTINAHIRERLAREGAIHGPAFHGEQLVSRGYTRAEKSLAANYAPGDVVSFHRPYRRLGIDKGEERRVVEVDRRSRTVVLADAGGKTVAWKPGQVAGRHGGSEVYRVEPIELRAGDRVRWTRNDKDHGLVNSRTAEVVSVDGDRVAFRLEDGRALALGRDERQLRHLDHAHASTVHAFQGRTVDNVIAAMEAEHPHLTTQKSFYVEISRARYRAELVTDDAARLQERLETTTGERISALEAIATREPEAPARGADAPGHTAAAPMPERPAEAERGPEARRSAPDRSPGEPDAKEGATPDRPPSRPAREKPLEVEFELELEL